VWAVNISPDGKDVNYDIMSRIENQITSGSRIVACAATPTRLYYTLQDEDTDVEYSTAPSS
jgi:hypothetical protein